MAQEIDREQCAAEDEADAAGEGQQVPEREVAAMAGRATRCSLYQ
jgi:hypothetical protein